MSAQSHQQPAYKSDQVQEALIACLRIFAIRGRKLRHLADELRQGQAEIERLRAALPLTDPESTIPGDIHQYNQPTTEK